MHLEASQHSSQPSCGGGINSCPAVQNNMGAVLDILLNPKRGVSPYHPVKDYREHIIAALQMQDPKSGVTLLGQAVAWGYDEALLPILDAVR